MAYMYMGEKQKNFKKELELYCNLPKPPAVCVWEDNLLQEFTTGGVLKWPFSKYSPAPLNSQQAVRKNLSFLYIYIYYVYDGKYTQIYMF